MPEFSHENVNAYYKSPEILYRSAFQLRGMIIDKQNLRIEIIISIDYLLRRKNCFDWVLL